ncbi:outer membrane protein assembly factor BamB family protein [Haloarchaeobius sp. DT45]|uniref:PQQ-like beta-propeller repeat protein n=1 Tax=Haloarchaeobius sp. DT45 TaxID=3446116 RepID=UPI003F6B0122
MRRRTLLSAVAAGGAATLAGCSSGGNACADPPPTVDRPRDRWPTAGYDPANTAFAPAGPSAGEVQWVAGRDDGPGRYLVGFFSTPLVGDGRVFVAMRDYDVYSSMEDESGFLLAFDDETGTEQWRVELPRLTGGSPVLAGDRLFVGDTGGTLHAVSTDGDGAWRRDLGAPVRGTTVSGSTLFVVDDAATIHGFTLDGDRCWRHDQSDLLDDLFGGPSFAVDGAPAVDSSGLYVTMRQGDGFDGVARVQAFDHDGSLRWTYDFQAGQRAPNAPTVVDGTVVVTAGNQIHALDAESGDRRWRFVVGHDHTGAPATDGERVYVGAKNLYALSLADGTEQWRVVNDAVWGGIDYLNDVPFVAQPAVTDDAVYLRAGAFDPEDGTRLWGDLANAEVAENGAQDEYGWRPMVAPAVTSDALYLGHQLRGVTKIA